MQKLVLLVFLVTVGYCAAKYSHKYDHIKVDDVLKNVRLLGRYIDCVLDVPGSCTKDGSYLKEILPEAIQTNCRECDEKQKANALKVIASLMKHHKDWWTLVDNKYKAANSVFITSNWERIKYIQEHEV